MFVIVARDVVKGTSVYGPFPSPERASGEGLNRFGPNTFGAPVTWTVKPLTP